MGPKLGKTYCCVRRFFRTPSPCVGLLYIIHAQRGEVNIRGKVNVRDKMNIGVEVKVGE